MPLLRENCLDSTAGRMPGTEPDLLLTLRFGRLLADSKVVRASSVPVPLFRSAKGTRQICSAHGQTASPVGRGRFLGAEFALLDLDKDHSEGEQGERFDEGEAKNHQQLNAGGGSWVAGDGFYGRTDRFALADAAEAGSQRDADADADWSKVNGAGSALGKRRNGEAQD